MNFSELYKKELDLLETKVPISQEEGYLAYLDAIKGMTKTELLKMEIDEYINGKHTMTKKSSLKMLTTMVDNIPPCYVFTHDDNRILGKNKSDLMEKIVRRYR